MSKIESNGVSSPPIENPRKPFATSELRDTSQELQELRKQLAASQAREQQLRENVRVVCGPVMDAFTDGQRWNDYQEIIDQPTDTAVLEAMIEKASELMRERCAVICENMEHDDHGRLSREDFAEAIRAIQA